MAGNKNPWRDIPSWNDWTTGFSGAFPTFTRYHPPTKKKTGLTKLLSKKEPDVDTEAIFTGLTDDVYDYHRVEKDDYRWFGTRAKKLEAIANVAETYLAALGTNVVAKPTTGKTAVYGDRVDPWIASLAKRARKKAEYLRTMTAWHKSTKTKYKDPAQLLVFLGQLDAPGGNVKGAHREFLHTGPYAALEKVDPYHRHHAIWVERNMTGQVTGVRPWDVNRPLAIAMQQYFQEVMGLTPRTLGNKANPTFYEWLECHEICTGTPRITGGYNMRWKDLLRMDYKPQLRALSVSGGKIRFDRNNNGWLVALNTPTDFPASHKGPTGSAAFVWDKAGALWLHEHGGQFVHTSFTGGRTIRCSGMMRVDNGKVTVISDESGHYRPGQRQIYYLTYWLHNRSAMLAPPPPSTAPAAMIRIHGQAPAPVLTFLTNMQATYGVPAGLPA